MSEISVDSSSSVGKHELSWCMVWYYVFVSVSRGRYIICKLNISFGWLVFRYLTLAIHVEWRHGYLLQDLFERAIRDYPSVNVWLEYCQWSIGALSADPSKVREVFERAINSAGYHVIFSFFLHFRLISTFFLHFFSSIFFTKGMHAVMTPEYNCGFLLCLQLVSSLHLVIRVWISEAIFPSRTSGSGGKPVFILCHSS